MKEKDGTDMVMDECKKRLPTEWGYEGDTAKRYERYTKVHEELLGTKPSKSDLQTYDKVKFGKSSLINVILSRYGSGPRQFCFPHPRTGHMITLDDNTEAKKARDEFWEFMWIGFQNTEQMMVPLYGMDQFPIEVMQLDQ